MFYRSKFIVPALMLLLLPLSLFLSSCSTKADGPDPVKESPVVQIVNIPASGSHFTSSPLVNWFGTDADGYIVAYEYAVISASVVVANVDTSNIAALRSYAEANIQDVGPTATCDPACWTVIDVSESDSPTRQQVRLVAGDSPADTVVQFFFLRALDNDGKYSLIDYSIYSRSNNPPNTEISTVPDRKGYFDLPDTSSSYGGISFDWKGTDKIDFPNDTDQPEFEYFYQVFGPFASTDLQFNDSTGRFLEGYVFDTVSNHSKLIITSQDTIRGGSWVTTASARFFNLWRNESSSNETRVNYFVVKVTSRDDASTPDPTPDYVVFKAIYPKFENRVLLVGVKNCNFIRPGDVPCDHSSFEDVYTIDSLFDYYQRIFDKAGYTDAAFRVQEMTGAILPTDQACRYKVIVVFSDGNSVPTIPAAFMTQLAEYMRIGGNVWVWSSSPFGTGYSVSALTAFTPSSLHYRYFRVLAEYRAAWGVNYQARTFYPPDSAGIPVPNDQFVGGLALNGTGFHNVSADMDKVQKTYNYLRQSNLSKDHWQFLGVPNATYMIRDLAAEPLFLFNSHFEGNIPDSLKTWVGPLHGTVVAVRYDSGQFRTSVFAFPAWSIYEDDAVHIVDKMMTWFLR